MAGAEHAGQKAQAIEHHTRGPGTVDGILEGRLGARLPSLEKPGEGIGGNARHFHRHEHHQEVIGGGHQAHAEGRAQDERVEVGAILGIGNAGDLREQDEQHEESGEEQANVGRERIEGEETTKQLLPPGEEITDR